MSHHYAIFKTFLKFSILSYWCYRDNHIHLYIPTYFRRNKRSAMVSCSRFFWITNSSGHERGWTANLLHTKELPSLLQEIRSSNLCLLTGICDPNKSWTWHHSRPFISTEVRRYVYVYVVISVTPTNLEDFKNVLNIGHVIPHSKHADDLPDHEL